LADKSFEHALAFFEWHPDPTNPAFIVWLPLVTVALVTPAGPKVDLSLMFDTGAAVTTLRADLYPLLGLADWNVGTPVGVTTASDPNAQAYRYDVTLEFLGKTLTGPVQLMQLPAHPLYVGLFGRDTFFEAFGFGFWESSHELLATSTP
jgi:hypothetical protein